MNIQAQNLNGNSVPFNIDTYPSECPLCHTNIHPQFISAIQVPNDRSIYRIDAAFKCTQHECRRLFIATYRGEKIGHSFCLSKTAPLTPQQHSFPPEIEEISPTFVEIYNQVAAAEALGLNQLVGMGLRKALEFLIKDYAISQKPEKEKEKIKSAFLNNCIKDFIDDPKVKQCAKLANWLANDETHYIRKWDDKDIEDVKILITLTVNWIHSSILTDKYSKDMNGAKTTKAEEKPPKTP
jgi:hypothetical protein